MQTIILWLKRNRRQDSWHHPNNNEYLTVSTIRNCFKILNATDNIPIAWVHIVNRLMSATEWSFFEYTQAIYTLSTCFLEKAKEAKHELVVEFQNTDPCPHKRCHWCNTKDGTHLNNCRKAKT